MKRRLGKSHEENDSGAAEWNNDCSLTGLQQFQMPDRCGMRRCYGQASTNAEAGPLITRTD